MLRPFIIFEGTAANVRIKRKFEIFLFLWYNIYIRIEKGRELMAKVTQKDIEQFSELYSKYGSYAAVARETGFSASTISKYLKNIPKNGIAQIPFSGVFTPLAADEWETRYWNHLLQLSETEKEEIRTLWKELLK